MDVYFLIADENVRGLCQSYLKMHRKWVSSLPMYSAKSMLNPTSFLDYQQIIGIFLAYSFVAATTGSSTSSITNFNTFISSDDT